MTSPDSVPAEASAPSGTARASLLVILVAVAMYLPTLGHDLVYDDWFLIDPMMNRSMQGVVDDFGVAIDLFTQEYWEGVNPAGEIESLKAKGQALYRPLTLFMWATVSHFYGYENSSTAWPYHLLNIVFNAWVVYLVLHVVLRMFGSMRVAVLTALLFATHPLHAEAVAYVAGLSDVITAGTVLLGLLCWLKATSDPSKLKIGPYVGMLLCMFIGLLAKEAGVLVLAAIALTDVMFALRGRVVAMSHRVATYVGLLVVLASQLALRYAMVGYLKPKTDVISALDNVLINVDTSVRVANAFKLLAKYLWLILWPQDMSIDYSKSAIDVSPGFSSPEPMAGLIVIGVMVLLGLMKLRRAPAFAWGLLFFVGTATFVSNMIVPIGTVFAERLMYLPSLGICLAVAVLVDRMLKPSGEASSGLNPVGLLIAVLIMGGAAFRTYDRNADFKDATVLFEAAEEVVPESARVHFQLGTLYHNQALPKQAIAQLELSLKYDPQFIRAAIQLGDVYATSKNWDQAIDTFSRVLAGASPVAGAPEQFNAIQAMVLNKRAEARRRNGDLTGAASDLEQAASLGVPDAGSDMRLARLLQGQEKWEESIPVLQNALALTPDDVGLTLMLSRAAIMTGDAPLYRETLQALKDSERGRHLAVLMEAETTYERSAAEQNEELRTRAMEMFEEVIQADDQLALPYVYRGRYMAEKTRYPYDAIVEYERALERAPNHPMALLYKALAEMNLELYEEAIETLSVLETVNPGTACLAMQAEAYFMLGELDELEKVHERMREGDTEPLEMMLNRAIAYSQRGEQERAIEIVNQAFVIPEYVNDPRLWRHLGFLNLDLRRYDEALAAFDQQQSALLQDAESTMDPFLEVNKARCFIGLGREMEAAAEFEKVEFAISALPDGDMLRSQLQAQLLLRQSELSMREGGAFYNPTEAEALCLQGFELTGRGFPPFFDRSIEALTRGGDLGAALARAREAQEMFFKLPRFGSLVEALELALGGDVQGALARLAQAVEDGEDDYESLLRMQAALQEG